VHALPVVGANGEGVESSVPVAFRKFAAGCLASPRGRAGGASIAPATSNGLGSVYVVMVRFTSETVLLPSMRSFSPPPPGLCNIVTYILRN
jgi:hypothetical protein